MRLENKVALITGAGAGIGRESALLFAAEGAKVACVDINEETAQATVAEVEAAGGTALAIAADVSSAEHCERMVKLTEETYGALHVLFNNAGVMLSGDDDAPVRKPPRRRLRSEDIKGFLCCEPFRPVPLADDRPMIVMGRSRNSDLVLPHESVSRAHAVVRVLGDEITLEDKSTYGTVVNGERIREGKLEVGDVILVVDVGGGTSDFSLIAVLEEEGALQLRRDLIALLLAELGERLEELELETRPMAAALQAARAEGDAGEEERLTQELGAALASEEQGLPGLHALIRAHAAALLAETSDYERAALAGFLGRELGAGFRPLVTPPGISDRADLRVSDGRLRLDLCYLALAKRRLPDAVREERAARGATSHGTPLRLLLAYLELPRRGERIGHALAVQAWSQLPLRRPPLEVGLLYVPAEAVRARMIELIRDDRDNPLGMNVGSAAEVLGLLGASDQGEVALLEGLLSAPGSSAHQGAARGLGHLGSRASLPKLEALAQNDSEYYVREAAKEAIAALQRS